MIAEVKITEVFYVIDKFNKNLDNEMSKHALISLFRKWRRNRQSILSKSEIMTILVLFYLSHSKELKIYIHLRQNFLQVVSNSRVVELESSVFFNLYFF